MPNRKIHCQDCLIKMGEEFDKVHKWLDGLSSPKRGYLNINHRRYRHHKEGVEEIRKMWGERASYAAELHILLDFGYIPTKEQIEKEIPDKVVLISFKDLNKK